MSVRIRRSKRHHAEAGRHKDGGPRPFGITRDWSEVVADEAALIREAADRVLGAQSLRSIAIDWQARGIATSRGGMWTGSAIGKLLLQERLYGVRVHDGRVVAVGSWPRILDEATCARLRAVLTDPARRPGPSVHSYLLTGLLRCGRCGGRMRSTKPKTGKRTYQCATKPEGCGGVSILADETEHQVVEHVLEAVASPTFLKAPTVDAQAEELAAAIAADQSQLEELARDWAAKMISRGEWLAARNAVQARVDEARQHLAADAVTLPASAADLPERWEALSFDQRRASLRAVIDRVEIRPAAVWGRNRFDSERIAIVWRT